MKPRLEHLVLLIIILSIGGKLLVIHENSSLWWDEAVYLSLARALGSGQYTLDPSYPLESFRPPVLPALLIPISGSVFLSRALVILISALTVLALYFTTKDMFDKRTAIWASLFLATNQMFIFFSTKALSEPLFIAFFSLTVMYFARWIRKPDERTLFISGIFMALTFMTRYFGSLLMLVCFIYLIWVAKKERNPKGFLIFLGGIVLALIPWFIIGLSYYGNPVGSFITNFNVYYVSTPSDMVAGVQGILNAWSYMAVFVIAGLWFTFRKKKPQKPLIFTSAVLLLSLLSFVVLPHKETRYLLSFFPVYALLGALGLEHVLSLNKKAKPVLIFIVIALSLATTAFGLQDAWADRVSSASLVQASLDLKEMTEPGDIIFSQSYPYIVYLSERPVVPFCENHVVNDWYEYCQGEMFSKTWKPEALIPLMQKYGSRHLVYYKFEPLGDHVFGYLNSTPRFTPIRTYEQWNDPEAAIIYEFE